MAHDSEKSLAYKGELPAEVELLRKLGEEVLEQLSVQRKVTEELKQKVNEAREKLSLWQKRKYRKAYDRGDTLPFDDLMDDTKLPEPPKQTSRKFPQTTERRSGEGDYSKKERRVPSGVYRH